MNYKFVFFFFYGLSHFTGNTSRDQILDAGANVSNATATTAIIESTHTHT